MSQTPFREQSLVQPASAAPGKEANAKSFIAECKDDDFVIRGADRLRVVRPRRDDLDNDFDSASHKFKLKGSTIYASPAYVAEKER